LVFAASSINKGQDFAGKSARATQVNNTTAQPTQRWAVGDKEKQ
jgi:hypothetical protein